MSDQPSSDDAGRARQRTSDARAPRARPLRLGPFAETASVAATVDLYRSTFPAATAATVEQDLLASMLEQRSDGVNTIASRLLADCAAVVESVGREFQHYAEVKRAKAWSFTQMLTSEQQSRIRDIFPYMQFQVSPNASLPSQHPVASEVHRIMATQLHDRLDASIRTVVDVGSTPAKALAYIKPGIRYRVCVTKGVNDMTRLTSLRNAAVDLLNSCRSRQNSELAQSQLRHRLNVIREISADPRAFIIPAPLRDYRHQVDALLYIHSALDNHVLDVCQDMIDVDATYAYALYTSLPEVFLTGEAKSRHSGLRVVSALNASAADLTTRPLHRKSKDLVSYYHEGGANGYTHLASNVISWDYCPPNFYWKGYAFCYEVLTRADDCVIVRLVRSRGEVARRVREVYLGPDQVLVTVTRYSQILEKASKTPIRERRMVPRTLWDAMTTMWMEVNASLNVKLDAKASSAVSYCAAQASTITVNGTNIHMGHNADPELMMNIVVWSYVYVIQKVSPLYYDAVRSISNISDRSAYLKKVNDNFFSALSFVLACGDRSPQTDKLHWLFSHFACIRSRYTDRVEALFERYPIVECQSSVLVSSELAKSIYTRVFKAVCAGPTYLPALHYSPRYTEPLFADDVTDIATTPRGFINLEFMANDPFKSVDDAITTLSNLPLTKKLQVFINQLKTLQYARDNALPSPRDPATLIRVYMPTKPPAMSQDAYLSIVEYGTIVTMQVAGAISILAERAGVTTTSSRAALNRQSIRRVRVENISDEYTVCYAEGNLYEVADGKIKDLPETISHVFVNDDCKFFYGLAILRRLASIRLNNHQRRLLLIEAVPGAGKTTTIGSVFRAGDVAFTTTRSGRGELIAKIAPDERGNNKHIFEAVRTYSSGLINYKGATSSFMFADECFMEHVGCVELLANMYQCEAVVALGDSKQIPYTPFIANWTVVFDEYVDVSCRQYMTVTYRNPPQICYLMRHNYPNGYTTVNSIPLEYESRIDRTAVQAVSLVLRSDPKAHAVEMMQVGKAQVERLNPGRVNTAHELQGATVEHLVMYRLQERDFHLYQMNGNQWNQHQLSALTRVSRKLTYISVVPDAVHKAIQSLPTDAASFKPYIVTPERAAARTAAVRRAIDSFRLTPSAAADDTLVNLRSKVVAPVGKTDMSAKGAAALDLLAVPTLDTPVLNLGAAPGYFAEVFRRKGQKAVHVHYTAGDSELNGQLFSSDDVIIQLDNLLTDGVPSGYEYWLSDIALAGTSVASCQSAHNKSVLGALLTAFESDPLVKRLVVKYFCDCEFPKHPNLKSVVKPSGTNTANCEVFMLYDKGDTQSTAESDWVRVAGLATDSLRRTLDFAHNVPRTVTAARGFSDDDNACFERAFMSFWGERPVDGSIDQVLRLNMPMAKCGDDVFQTCVPGEPTDDAMVSKNQVVLTGRSIVFVAAPGFLTLSPWYVSLFGLPFEMVDAVVYRLAGDEGHYEHVDSVNELDNIVYIRYSLVDDVEWHVTGASPTADALTAATAEAKDLSVDDFRSITPVKYWRYYDDASVRQVAVLIREGYDACADVGSELVGTVSRSPRPVKPTRRASSSDVPRLEAIQESAFEDDDSESALLDVDHLAPVVVASLSDGCCDSAVGTAPTPDTIIGACESSPETYDTADDIVSGVVPTHCYTSVLTSGGGGTTTDSGIANIASDADPSEPFPLPPAMHYDVLDLDLRREFEGNSEIRDFVVSLNIPYFQGLHRIAAALIRANLTDPSHIFHLIPVLRQLSNGDSTIPYEFVRALAQRYSAAFPERHGPWTIVYEWTDTMAVDLITPRSFAELVTALGRGVSYPDALAEAVARGAPSRYESPRACCSLEELTGRVAVLLSVELFADDSEGIPALTWVLAMWPIGLWSELLFSVASAALRQIKGRLVTPSVVAPVMWAIPDAAARLAPDRFAAAFSEALDIVVSGVVIDVVRLTTAFTDELTRAEMVSSDSTDDPYVPELVGNCVDVAVSKALAVAGAPPREPCAERSDAWQVLAEHLRLISTPDKVHLIRPGSMFAFRYTPNHWEYSRLRTAEWASISSFTKKSNPITTANLATAEAFARSADVDHVHRAYLFQALVAGVEDFCSRILPVESAAWHHVLDKYLPICVGPKLLFPPIPPKILSDAKSVAYFGHRRYDANYRCLEYDFRIGVDVAVDLLIIDALALSTDALRMVYNATARGSKVYAPAQVAERILSSDSACWSLSSEFEYQSWALLRRVSIIPSRMVFGQPVRCCKLVTYKPLPVRFGEVKERRSIYLRPTTTALAMRHFVDTIDTTPTPTCQELVDKVVDARNVMRPGPFSFYSRIYPLDKAGIIFDAVERTPFVRIRDPVAHIQHALDALLPGNRFVPTTKILQDIERTNLSFTTDNVRLKGSRLCARRVREVTAFEPRVAAARYPKRATTAKQLMCGLQKRNWVCAKMAEPAELNLLASAAFEKTASTFFRAGWRTEVKSFMADPVVVTTGGLEDWINRLPAQKREGLKAADIRHWLEMRLNEYTVSLKPDSKVVTSVKQQTVFQSVQVIAAHEPYYNVVWSVLVRQLTQRLKMILRDNVCVNIGYDGHDIQKFIAWTKNHTRPWAAKNDCGSIEVDASAFDKSQQEAAHKIKLYFMRALGLPDYFCWMWDISHRWTKNKAYGPGVSFYVPYQQKSGNAATAFGNTVINMASMAYVLPTCSFDFALFLGDDNFISAPMLSTVRGLRLHDVRVADFSRVFNMEVKFVNSRYGYFCGWYLLCVADRWYVVPDPVKKMESICNRDITDLAGMYERWISFTDACRCYLQPEIVPTLARAVADRFATSYDVSDAIYALASMAADFRTYSRCFGGFVTRRC
nr:TPA_asm: hypothetical protein [Psilosi virus]